MEPQGFRYNENPMENLNSIRPQQNQNGSQLAKQVAPLVSWIYVPNCNIFTDVLGLEQFKLGHDNGGSQDHSRIMYVVTA